MPTCNVQQNEWPKWKKKITNMKALNQNPDLYKQYFVYMHTSTFLSLKLQIGKMTR